MIVEALRRILAMFIFLINTSTQIWTLVFPLNFFIEQLFKKMTASKCLNAKYFVVYSILNTSSMKM